MNGLSVLAALGATAVGCFAHGTFHRNSAVFGHVLHVLPGDGKRVALTFDDGPNAAATPMILDTLEQEEVPAAFFVVGKAVERHPDLVRRAADAGHQIGNHGYEHRKLHLRTPAAVRRDLELGTAAIERACGVRPRYFRAPHGFRSPWVTPIARSLGQLTVGWTLGVWDTARPGVEVIVRRVIDGVSPGAIVLLHDGDGYDFDGDRMQTARALSLIVKDLRERGYTFERLANS